MRERELIEWIRSRTPRAGDDCAVLPCAPWGNLLVTVDSVVDGVHAHWIGDGPDAFGWKAVARGLSDIAAMGGEPLWVVLAATLPPDTGTEDARDVLRGAERALRELNELDELDELDGRFAAELVGGDTAHGALAVVSATVLGRADEPVLRSGAQPGDRLVVSGPLGRSYRSGWHLRFRPRVAEAARLRRSANVTAMIDLSDGLATDLFSLVEASGVGADLESARIPLREGADLDAALGDGEDYELLAAIAPGAEPPDPFVLIGTVTDGEVRLDGRPLERRGYEHRT